MLHNVHILSGPFWLKCSGQKVSDRYLFDGECIEWVRLRRTRYPLSISEHRPVATWLLPVAAEMEQSTFTSSINDICEIGVRRSVRQPVETGGESTGGGAGGISGEHIPFATDGGIRSNVIRREYLDTAFAPVQLLHIATATTTTSSEGARTTTRGRSRSRSRIVHDGDSSTVGERIMGDDRTRGRPTTVQSRIARVSSHDSGSMGSRGRCEDVDFRASERFFGSPTRRTTSTANGCVSG